MKLRPLNENTFLTSNLAQMTFKRNCQSSFLRKYPEKQLAQIAVELGQEEHPLGHASQTLVVEFAMNPA